MTKKTCAIYTRKSTDERLDMEFNTLDAQREACEAYIVSQKSEGWAVSEKHYDDGGFSGGSLDRPALGQLLDDIKAGKVNIVVVYKIDRLTRSLMDFSKLVEVFDAHDVTFVSVTQSFNTTTSMGRLTLNVLLSFAQFEREVTGERIRDKIKASKKKGMWMGGAPPLGYVLKERRLYVNETEAPLARQIFKRYLELGCVANLKKDFDRRDIVSPVRISKKGRQSGNKPFSRGALYAILKSSVYIGRMPHKETSYPSEHVAIIPQEMWDKVQKQLQKQSVTRNTRMKRRNPLKGLIFDMDGVPYSPTFTKKKTKEYRYYISQNLLQSRDQPKGLIARLPAQEIEDVVEGAIFDFEKIHKVIVDIETVTIKTKDQREIVLPYETNRTQHGAVVIEPEQLDERDIFDMPQADLKKLVQGYIWRDEHFNGKSLKDIAGREGRSEWYVGDCVNKTFLFLNSL